MLDRAHAGELPPKPHLVFRASSGAQYYEECLTRGGFEGPFSILYHQHRPHEARPIEAPMRFAVPEAATELTLSRHHYQCLKLPERAEPALSARTPLLFNEHVTLAFVRPSSADPAYFVNADADELFFILQGSGTLRSLFGDLSFGDGDYVCIPKGTLYRFMPDEGAHQAWLCIEARSGLGLPQHYRNAIGQLRMDAPYSHRDFRRPVFAGPMDESIRAQVVKRGDRFFGFEWSRSPLDVVGWDGTVYPFALPITAFQPRVGLVHLPPPVHATFEAQGAIICSFVPRLLDFHEDANPCPYPHSSIDMDEVLLYANDSFTSRRGIALGSLSHHPAGVCHGPHPGAYERATERSRGVERTDELAVMLDTMRPLSRTAAAIGIEDPEYHASFIAS